jgi:hypothetical protein
MAERCAAQIEGIKPELFSQVPLRLQVVSVARFHYSMVRIDGVADAAKIIKVDFSLVQTAR